MTVTRQTEDAMDILAQAKLNHNGLNKTRINGMVQNGYMKVIEDPEEVGESEGDYTSTGKLPAEIGTDYTFKRKIVWFNTIGFLILHLLALYGLYLAVVAAKWQTIAWMLVLAFGAGEGVTIGAHRLFSHKAYKAKPVLKFLLIVLQTIAGQNCMYIWVRDHRQHHKYSDTDADPHNSHRGFFFSHIGWLMSRKHPAVISKGKTIDMSDMEADPIVMFQKTYYKPLYVIFAIALPVAGPVYLWNEDYITSFFVSYFFRYMFTLHVTWLVNSAAHIYGTRPYDKTLKPVESTFVSIVSFGEGWHNYHHAFPWDYRAAEFGVRFNVTTHVINFLASIGLIYDLKVASYELVKKRIYRVGDGTHYLFNTDENQNIRETCPETDHSTIKRQFHEENNNIKKRTVQG